MGWVFRPLDGTAMEAAAAHLVGEHDFTSFRASACQAKSPVKTMHRIEIRSGSRKPYLTYMTVDPGEERRIRHDFNAKAIRPPR